MWIGLALTIFLSIFEWCTEVLSVGVEDACRLRLSVFQRMGPAAMLDVSSDVIWSTIGIASSNIHVPSAGF